MKIQEVARQTGFLRGAHTLQRTAQDRYGRALAGSKRPASHWRYLTWMPTASRANNCVWRGVAHCQGEMVRI